MGTEESSPPEVCSPDQGGAGASFGDRSSRWSPVARCGGAVHGGVGRGGLAQCLGI